MFHTARFYEDFDGNVLPARPYGLYLHLDSHDVDHSIEGLHADHTDASHDEIRYEGWVEGKLACGIYAKSPVSFTLPKPDKEGFFWVGSTQYVIANVGFPSPWHPFATDEFHFLKKPQVALRILENMFGSKTVSIPGSNDEENYYSPLSNFFFQSIPGNIVQVNNEHLQAVLLSRLVTHPFIRQIQRSPLQRQGSKDLVLLHHRRDGVRVDPLKFTEKMLYRLDPTSTSSSDAINRTYQLAEGARIENGAIIPGEYMYCAFTRRNSVLLEMNPTRACLDRSAVMNSCELTHPEPRPISSPGSLVHTRNLVTAFVDLGVYTFEDTIAMSRSCANKFEGQTVTSVVCWSEQPIHEMKVEKGDIVSPNQVIARHHDEIHDENDNDDLEDNKTFVNVVASRLSDDSILENISVSRAWYAGVYGYRTVFDFRTYHPMQDGDKITGFAGCKGVVRILDDEKMPFIHGQYVDICVSPMSVFKRGTLGLEIEAAIGKAWACGEFPTTNAFGDDEVVDARWAAMNYRKKDPAFLNGKQLPENVFWGIVPWMRIAKSGIASKRASSVGRDRPLTSEDRLPDTAGTAGQSMDMSKSIVMMSRGMPNTLKAILGNTPGGLETLTETVAAINGPAN